MRRILSSAWALLAVGFCREPSALRSGTNAALLMSDVSIPLEPYFRDLRMVRLPVGRDTLSLLVDTGGGATLITPQVAAAHGCHPHGADVGHRMTGEAVVFARCDSLRLGTGAWSVSLAPIGVFDVNALLPNELPRLDGVLALDAFRGYVLTVDWRGGFLTVHATGSADAAAVTNGIALRAATGESGRFLTVLTPVEGAHELLWFLLDSGDLQGTLIAYAVLRDSLLPLRAPNVARLSIGGRPAIDLPFHAADLVLDGVFGTDYFRRGPVTLDLRDMPSSTRPNPRVLPPRP